MKNIVVVGLTLWALITLYISLPGFNIPHWISNMYLPHSRTIGYHLVFLMHLLSVVLIFRGVILVLKNKGINDLKPFRFPMQFLVAQNIFLLIASIFGSENSLWLLNENFDWSLKTYYYISFTTLWLVVIYALKNPIDVASMGENKQVIRKGRFFNFIIDKAIIVTLVFGHLKIASNGFILDDFEFFRKSVTWWITLNGFFYYLVLEILFRQTIGKLHNNSYVLSLSNGVFALVIRTLCRLIPFEVFSFLGSKGWHDSLSRTSVVKGQKE